MYYTPKKKLFLLEIASTDSLTEKFYKHRNSPRITSPYCENALCKCPSEVDCGSPASIRSKGFR
jgi:hypothetical protein